MTFASITVSELRALQQSGAPLELIDVRTPAEFAAVHVEFAQNQPLDQLDVNSIQSARANPEQRLYVICKMGGRSTKACQQFVDANIANIVNVAGGTDAWLEAGYDVDRSDRKAMALDRQVRIAAGSLVLTGVAVSALVQPAWIGLVIAGFIGGGLVFSGLTDTCGMGMLISKMPWNK